VHVSGHASQEEIKLLIHLVKPQYVIPIHGELRMLKQHAKLAEQVGIPSDAIAVVENGQVIEFENGKMAIKERIPGGYVFVDGARAGDVDYSVMREREALSRDGIVLITLTLETKSGRLLGEPEVITRGFVPAGGASDIIAATRQRINAAIQRAEGDLQNEIEQTVKTFLFNETKRRPMVFVTISRV
jgi:ribonuclease J